MRRILFLSAMTIISLFSFYGCDDENKILSDENDKPIADSVKISITLNCDSLSLYVDELDTLIATVRNGDKIVDYQVSWSIDNSSIAVVDSNGVVTALSVGTAVITAKYEEESYICKVVVNERPIIFEYVDLGLSVCWATFNVGATKPEEFGDYYAWGETETKSNYDWPTYKWCNGSSSTLTKYCNNSDYGNEGFTDTLKVLTTEDDVAHVKWGGSWRMPTMDELIELRNSCTWTRITINGVNGYRVTSNKEGYTDCSIFLPAAGIRGGTRLLDVGNVSYWSSSLYPGSPYYAYVFDFDPSFVYWFGGNRYYGSSVRPVCPINVESFAIDCVELSLIPGNTHSFQALINGVVRMGVNWSSDNESVASVNSDGEVTAISIGTTTITAMYQDRFSSCTIKVVDESEIEHEYVDLGLSVKWATRNVGAIMPQDYGNYYAWGETETKSNYVLSTYKWCNGSSSTFIKYCNISELGNEGFTDTLTVLIPEDDVAHMKWGGSWRMPTQAEQDELRNNCTWTWTTLNGVNGYRITSNKEGYTDRSIFLPAAGYRRGTTLDFVGSYGGFYWSSSLYTFSPNIAWYFAFYLGSNYVGTDYNHDRWDGLSVRPVCP